MNIWEWSLDWIINLDEQQESKKDRENEERSYKEAFDYFDWNKSGTIPTSDLQCAMRRAGQNPTDVEVFLRNKRCLWINELFACIQVQDMVNKIDDGSGVLDFEDFLLVMKFLTNVYTAQCNFLNQKPPNQRNTDLAQST